MKNNSCTPINPKKYSCYGPQKIHTRNLITKKNSCGSEISLPAPHNFSNGPSPSSRDFLQFPIFSPAICCQHFLCFILRNRSIQMTVVHVSKACVSSYCVTSAWRQTTNHLTRRSGFILIPSKAFSTAGDTKLKRTLGLLADAPLNFLFSSTSDPPALSQLSPPPCPAFWRYVILYTIGSPLA